MLINEDRIVITGFGSISPAGDTGELWDKTVNMNSSLVFSDDFTEDCPVQVVGKVHHPLTGIFNDKVSSFVSRHCLLGALSLDECIKISKGADLHSGRTGLIFGSATHGLDKINETFNLFNSVKFKDIDYNVVNSITNGGACRLIASRFNINGYVHAVEGASCSGMIALATGYNLIRAGLCDRVFCVSGEANLFPVAYLFYKRKVRYPDLTVSFFGKLENPEVRMPEHYVVPFCIPSESDRGVVAEGGGAILLESRSTALSRGADIYAEMEDAHLDFQNSDTGSDKNRINGLFNVINKIGNRPFDSVYFPVTGCHPLDENLYSICSEFYPGTHAFTAEPIIGHTGAATSMFNTILAILSICKQTLLPTKNIRQDMLDSSFKLSPSKTPVGRADISRILVLGNGWGGYTGGCIVKRYEK